MGCESARGEAANTTSGNGSSSCYDTQDAFVNFQIDNIFNKFEFFFKLSVNPPKEEIGFNDYAVNELFGIVDAYVTTIKYYKDGKQYFGCADDTDNLKKT